MVYNFLISINGFFWGYFFIYVLLFCGVYFTFRLRLVQFIRCPEMFRTLLQPRGADPGGVSPFQALCTSLAARVGAGNIAGVAVALYLGGPGAVFWMWVMAALGMATAFAESTLAQLFKIRDASGNFRGGPAFYIARGLGAPRAAAVFALCLILAFGLVFNAVQASAISEALHGAFGANRLATGLVLMVAVALVVLGGLRAIVGFASLVVPLMAGAYLAVAVAALVINASAVPAMLRLIIDSAFGLAPAAGGVAGSVAAAMLNGVRRGLFSNEAGVGSAPNIAAAAAPNPHHPCSQGFVQAFGVFIDTILICTATALLVLLSGRLEPGSGVTGVLLTQQAMSVHLGAWGSAFIAVAMLFFAYTTIIGNYAYAEAALVYLRVDGRAGRAILRLGLLAMVLWGALQPITLVFEVADVAMGVMTGINVVAILMLSGVVARLVADYGAQRDAGISPVFDAASMPDLAGRIDAEIWRRPEEASLSGATPGEQPPAAQPVGCVRGA